MCAKHLFSLAKRLKSPHVTGARRQIKHQTVPQMMATWALNFLNAWCALSRCTLSCSVLRPRATLIKMNEKAWLYCMIRLLASARCGVLVCRSAAALAVCWGACIPRNAAVNESSTGRRVDWWYSFLIMIRHPPDLSCPLLFADHYSSLFANNQWIDIATSQAPAARL
jgi:hypothetical protein